MEITISYEEMKKRYPEIIKEFIEKLRKGKSKERLSDEKELTYKFSWGIAGKACSFNEIINNLGKDKDPSFFDLYQDNVTIENIEKYFGNRIIWSFIASIKKWTTYIIPSEPYPKEILEYYIPSFKREVEDYKYFNSLTPEEKQKDIENCLKELRKDPGFFEVSIVK